MYKQVRNSQRIVTHSELATLNILLHTAGSQLSMFCYTQRARNSQYFVTHSGLATLNVLLQTASSQLLIYRYTH